MDIRQIEIRDLRTNVVLHRTLYPAQHSVQVIHADIVIVDSLLREDVDEPVATDGT